MEPLAPEIATAKAPDRHLCTDCGISRSSDPKACGRACQFIDPDYPRLERAVHGRTRVARPGDERFFGVTRQMLRARIEPGKKGAQWSGITTTLGEELLKHDLVDAILTVAPHKDDRWRPEPVLITDANDMARVRGMRMGYAPLLALLDRAKARGFERLAVIGIPCQVYALRALETELGFSRLFVIGTPCSDNTTTQNFHTFLSKLSTAPETITYLEFRADYQVELRFQDGRTQLIPFLKLPLSDLPPNFFPLTCKTCVDYTNSLADITIGYMGGDGDQWLIVRNDRGAELLSLLEPLLTVRPLTEKGKRASSVNGFIANTERAAGGLPVRNMPDWVRPIVAWLMPKIGPRGLEFARARVEMKAAETILHLRRAAPRRMKAMIPSHVWALAAPYGLTPQEGEQSGVADADEKETPCPRA
ncbi:MAG: Coenzyme F420 hydrogenase/dehydrogenase, beta subunit C-terminal domain [Pseudomonadota bacterium]